MNRASVSLRTVVLACIVFWAAPVHAHKLNVFAAAKGNVISGHVYESGGERVSDALVSITGPHGVDLGKVRTDKNGEFSFTARYRCDHTFIVSTTDGHGARFTVKAGELPATLPMPPAGKHGHSHARSKPHDHGDEPHGHGSTSDVQEAVSRAIRPLREQIDELQHKIFWHDVLGGIGYILGLMGITFYFLGARKLQEGRANSGEQRTP